VNIDFKCTSVPLRLYSGENALDNLPSELHRCKAKRAFVLCGRTVSRRSDLIARIRSILGGTCVGLFDEIEKDSTLPSVLRAAEAARAAAPDVLVAVGGGSVVQAARVVLILLAESRPLEQMVTQYPEHGPAISPKLLAPKLPVINVLTLPTAAQNRGGSAIRNDALEHRMEVFDPKTRPVAIFWDRDALLTAPLALARAAACTVYWRIVMNLGWKSINPLLEGTRLHAFRLASRAIVQLDSADPAARTELCAAALLLNRDADEGGLGGEKHWPARVSYALATALLLCYPNARQGEALTAVTGTVLRQWGAGDSAAMVQLAQNLGLWTPTTPDAAAPGMVADYLDGVFTRLAMPTRLRELGIPADGLSRIVERSLKNFNADPRQEFAHKRDVLVDTLNRCW